MPQVHKVEAVMRSGLGVDLVRSTYPPTYSAHRHTHRDIYIYMQYINVYIYIHVYVIYVYVHVHMYMCIYICINKRASMRHIDIHICPLTPRHV